MNFIHRVLTQLINKMITYPNAKINLGLNITEKRPDGYHNLETVFYPINLQDALEVKLLEGEGEYTLKTAGTPIEGDPENNLVVKAYRILKQDFPKMKAVDIHMYKHIPTGAGLGGGSADAAFMLKLLNEKFKLQLSTEQLEGYASKLGADCAFFVYNTPMMATGIGTEFSALDLSLKGVYLALVKPKVFVSTADAYRSVTPKEPTFSLQNLTQLRVVQYHPYLRGKCEFVFRNLYSINLFALLTKYQIQIKFDFHFPTEFHIS